MCERVRKSDKYLIKQKKKLLSAINNRALTSVENDFFLFIIESI